MDAAGLIVGGVEFANDTQVEQSLAESSRKILERAAAASSSAGVTVERALPETGELGQTVAYVVAAEAKTWKADLIVIGTHGLGDFKHLLLHRVAEGIVRVSPAPVLLVGGR